jgi:iron complex outermembrane receptor protein
MKSIPAAAIERIEVLRDGAAAQYGSDAIAGVINIILKDDYEGSEVKLFAGTMDEGDGDLRGYSLNIGLRLGEKGFLNLTPHLHRSGRDQPCPLALRRQR